MTFALKKWEEPTKCVNCNGNHTANYRRCKTFNDILNHTKSNAKKINQKNHPILTSAVPPAPRKIENEALNSNLKEKPSYAEITANTPLPDQPLHIITKFLD